MVIEYILLRKDKRDNLSNFFDWYSGLDTENVDVQQALEGNQDLKEILPHYFLVQDLLVKFDINHKDFDTRPVLSYLISKQIESLPDVKYDDGSVFVRGTIHYGLRLLSQQIGLRNIEELNGAELEPSHFLNDQLVSLVVQYDNKVNRSSAISDLHPTIMNGTGTEQFNVDLCDLYD
ncbi:hypothetical protein HQ533_03310 [Candidatus Woesearchaeota archaeon]|nr:hypothetical protein [Candidatus Woesearchaeota archaeon]